MCIKRLFSTITHYFSLVKFAHTIFAMPFALIGYSWAIASGSAQFSLKTLLLILIAMVSARNSAMGFNRILDRDIDAVNPRTAQREIPAGKISLKSASIFVALNILIFIATAWLLNPLAFWLSFPTLAVLLGYSYMKRISALSHYLLGVALSIAPMGAFIAVSGRFDIAIVILSFIVLLWVGGFDIIYSLGDIEFDKKHSLHSIPRLFGAKRSLLISSISHGLVLPLLLLFATVINSKAPLLGVLYAIGALIFVLLLWWQHKIVSSHDFSRINAAFFTANGLASIIFALFTIVDLFF